MVLPELLDGWHWIDPIQMIMIHVVILSIMPPVPALQGALKACLAKVPEVNYLHSGQISAKEVFEAYSKKDPVAVQVIEQCIEYWGMAVANLVSIFNPEKIIFGGGIFGPAVQLLDRIAEEAVKWAQPIAMQEVILEGTSLKGDTGLFGAGFLAIRNEFMI